jgi:hypothetical protein
MSRRSRNSRAKASTSNRGGNQIPIIIGMAVAILALIAYLFLKSGDSNGDFSNAPELDYKSFLQSSKSHEGNTNKVIGMINNRQQIDGGTLLHVDWRGSDRDDTPLGIFVSEEIRKKFEGLNLDVSNSYEFIVRTNKSQLEAIHIHSK